MKTIKNILLTAIMAVTLLSSCDFGDINKSPNSPSTAFTSYLFTYSCKYIPWFVLGDTTNGYDPWQQEWPGYLSESKNNQYGPLSCTITYSRGSSIYLYALKNLDLIIKMNEDEAQKNETNVTAFGTTANQIAVAKTLSAFYYMTLTDINGPIVLSQAFKGASEDNWKPEYDTQETVYKTLDEMLTAAYAQFDESGYLNANADIIYGGDIAKWKKLNASIRMLLAIKLSDVAPETGKARFAAAYKDGGLATPADDFSYTFDDLNWNNLYYWVSPDYAGAGFTQVPNMFIVEEMKKLKDNRMFKYFDIEGYKGARDESIFPRDQYTSFYGIPFGLEDNNAVAAWKDCCCSVNSSLIGMSATIPVIPAARVLLTEAEAAQRGWISADPEELYKAGVKASFDQWGAKGADEYLKQPEVAFNNTIERIAIQRWIASYMSDGVEAWSDWRRLDVPYLPVGPGAITAGNTHYPYRLGYSADYDVQYNKENLEKAITTLYGGKDDVNSRVWWDVADNREGVLTPEQCVPQISIPEVWVEIGPGTFSSEFFGEEVSATLWWDQNHPTSYKIVGIEFEDLEPYDMAFTASGSSVVVETSRTGYYYDGYGQVYVQDDGSGSGKFDGDKTYTFVCKYTIPEAGVAFSGSFTEIFTLN